MLDWTKVKGTFRMLDELYVLYAYLRKSLSWCYPDICRLFSVILLHPLNNVEQSVRNSEGQTKENIALVCNAI